MSVSRSRKAPLVDIIFIGDMGDKTRSEGRKPPKQEQNNKKKKENPSSMTAKDRVQGSSRLRKPTRKTSEDWEKGLFESHAKSRLAMFSALVCVLVLVLIPVILATCLSTRTCNFGEVLVGTDYCYEKGEPYIGTDGEKCNVVCTKSDRTRRYIDVWFGSSVRWQIRVTAFVFVLLGNVFQM